MIPAEIELILERLESAGYSAYLVGGCVRDLLLSRAVSDYDITTSALPEETEAVFSDMRVIETGIKHGTVTVVSGSYNVEITTFRTDGEYLDSRHPESVSFSDRVEDDLARRDFTVNSVAMSCDGEIIDPYGGREDLARRTIRCTGDAEVRFCEDALRIIRALRFSSTLGFEIESKTSDAIHKYRDLLKRISVERVFTELKKLLCGDGVFRILTEYPDVICTIIPEMTPSVGFDQKNPYHIYDVYTHTAKTVEEIEPDATLRLAMLFHDIGKPYLYTEDEDGTRHFHGHPERSAAIARERLLAMHADGETVRLVTLLCSMHDRTIVPEKKPVKRLLSKLTYDEVKMLCKVQLADAASHAPDRRQRAEDAAAAMAIAEEIVRGKECFSIKDLAVNGDDLIELGYRGREIGDELQRILDRVINEEPMNDKKSISEYLNKKNKRT